MPTGSAWVRSQSGTLLTANERWENGRLVFFTDANQSTGTHTVTYTTTVQVVAGTTYTLSFLLQAAPGYNTSTVTDCGHVTTNLDVTATNGGKTTNLLSATSNKAGSGSRVIVAPPEQCTPFGSATSNFGSQEAVNETTTQSGSVTPTVTGAMTLQIVFTVLPATRGNNDDWRITPTFSACSR